jgi:biotin carboxyl carrier protein
MKFTYEHNDSTHTVHLERLPDGQYQATIGERTYTLHASRIADGGWLLRVNGQREIAYSASHESDRYIYCDGQQFVLTKVDPRRRRRAAASASGDLTAEMPGQVIDVRVTEGDTVQSGDVLLVLEAMKMEIRVTAPYDGTVSALKAAAGDVVERGQVLAEVTPAE